MMLSRWFDILKLRVQALVGRDRIEESMDDEMRYHVEQLTQANLAQGMAPRDAKAAALREFGSLTLLAEECRDARGVNWLENVLQDIRFGLRTFRRNPGFTFTAIASLALGLGGAIAVFAIVDSVLLQSLPVERPHELVTLDARIQDMTSGVQFADVQTLKKTQTVFSGIYATTGRFHVRITAGGRAIDHVPSAWVSHDFFLVLGLVPGAGRFFTRDEDLTPDSATTAGSVAVISYDFWQREYGGSPSAIGQTVLVNQVSCRLIGVTPRGFRGDAAGNEVDLWTPIVAFSSKKLLEASNGGMYAHYMARLKPGVTIAQAATQLTAAYQQIQSTRPKMTFFSRRQDSAGWQRVEAEAKDYRVVLEPGNLGFDVYRTRFQKPLWLMLGATFLVFLTGCANVASLLLSRGVNRRHELGIRAALGAGRSRIAMQLLVECLMLAVVSAVVGIAIGYGGSRVLVSLVDFGPASSRVTVDFGWRLVAFLLAIMLGSVLLFGLGPALRQTSQVISASGRAIIGRSQRANRALIVLQVALSVTLLSSAGLLAQTIYNLRNQDFGFRPEGLVAVQYWLNSRDGSAEHAHQVSLALLDRIRAMPGVTAAATSATGFFSGRDMFYTISIPGVPAGGPGARIDYVSDQYFEVMGVPLIRGRRFESKEDVPVAIANEAFIRKVMQGRDPIGVEMEMGSTKGVRIIGVVRDARYRNARIDYEPALFLPASTKRTPSRLEIRTAGNPSTVAASLRGVIHEADPDVVIESVSHISEDIDRSFNRELALAKLVGAFSALALTLSCIGLYGMMSYAVSRRVNEFGLRMALGARPAQVLAHVMRDSGLLLVLGVAIGIPCAMMASRLLEGLLFGVHPEDPRIYGAVVVVLYCAGLLAAWTPARRASSVDPATALRIE